MIASLIGIAIVDLGLTPRDPFRRRQPQRILDRAQPEVRGGLFPGRRTAPRPIPAVAT